MLTSRYELGEVLHDLVNRVISLETLSSGKTTRPLIVRNLDILDSLNIAYVHPGDLLFTDTNNDMIGTTISTILFGQEHQVTITDNGGGTALIGTVQDIDITSSPTFDSPTFTGSLTVNERMLLVPSLYTTAPTNDSCKFEMFGSNLFDTLLNIRRSDNLAMGPGILLQKSEGTLNIPASVKTDDVLGVLYFSGYDGQVPSTDLWPQSAGIVAKATENHNITSHGTNLKIMTTQNGNTTMQSRLIIDHNGVTTITCTEQSTDVTSGALVVNGGVGISGMMYLGGDLRITGTVYVPKLNIFGTDDATSLGVRGVLNVSGGASVMKRLYVGSSVLVGDGFGDPSYRCDLNTANNSGNLLKLTSGSGSTGFTMNSDSSLSIYKSNNIQNVQVCTLSNTQLTVNLTTNSTSSSTGSLVVVGGAGIEGTLNANIGIITSTRDSTSPSSGALTINGGVGIAESAFIGGNLTVAYTLNAGALAFTGGTITSTATSTSTSSGALTVYGGVGIGKDVTVGGAITSQGYIDTSTMNSTSTSSGALIVAGGAGITNNLYVGGQTNVTTTNANQLTIGYNNANNVTFDVSSAGDLTINSTGNNINFANTNDVYILSTTDSTDTITGSLVISGGTSITKNLYVGGTINGVSVTQAYFDNTTSIATDAFVYNAINTQNVVMDAPNGFENQTDSIMTYNPTTRIFTIAPTGTSFNIWISGIRYTYGTIQTLTHANTAGNYYFYFTDGSGLKQSSSFPSVYTSATCSIVTYISAGSGFLCEERHGSIMSPATHLELHKQIGTYLDSGCTIGNYILTPSVPTNAGNQFTLTSGVISDETLLTQISALSAGSYNVTMLTGASASWIYNVMIVPFNYTTTGYIEYNQYTGGTWVSTPLVDSTYVNYYVIAVNSLNTSTQIIIKPGQKTYSSVSLAQDETFSNLTISGLAPIEFVAIYQLTFGTSSTYTNLGKCRIEGVSQIVGTKTTITMGTQINNHNSLLGLQEADSGVTWGHINDQTQSISGIKTIADTSDSTSITSGSLIVSGGLGIAKSVNIGGQTNIITTTASTSKTSGALIVSGGVGIAKNLYVGGQTNITVSGNNQLTLGYDNTNNITFTVSSGGDLTVDAYGNDVNFANTDTIHILSTTTSTNTTTGALIVSGGIGVAKNLYVGGQTNITNTSTQLTLGYDATNNVTFAVSSIGDLTVDAYGNDVNFANTDTIHILSTTESTSITSGSFIVGGGVGIAKNLYVGGQTNITDTSTQLTLGYDATNNVTFAVSSVGDLTVDAYGNDVNFANTDTIHILFTADSTSSTIGTLVVGGGVGIAKNLYVGGQTNITTIAGDQLTLGYNSVNNVTFDVSSAGDLTLDTSGNDIYFANTDTIHILSTINSTNTTTGSFIVGGGVGIAKNLYVGGQTNITTTATNQLTVGYNSSNTATLDVSSIGDLTINATGNDINFANGDTVRVLSTINSTTTTTGSLIVGGGVGIAKNLYVGGQTNITTTAGDQLTLGYNSANNVTLDVSSGGDLTFDTSGNDIYFANTDVVHILSTINSTNTTTGSIIISGGASVAGNLNVGGYINGLINLNGTTQSTSTATGALIVGGGVGIAKNLFVGGQTNITTTGTQLTIGYDTTNNVTFSVTSVGDLNVDASGNDVNFDNSNIIHILSTANSTNTATGALIIGGGVGIAKNLFVGGQTNITTTTSNQLTLGYDATNNVTFGVTSVGDLNVDASGNDVNFNNSNIIHILSTANSTNTTTGALIVGGGAGIAKNLYIGGQTNITSTTSEQLIIGYNSTNNVSFNVSSVGDLTIDAYGNDINFDNTDIIHILSTTDSSSVTNGSLVVGGGVGVAKKLFVGGQTNIITTTPNQLIIGYNSSNTATFDVSTTGDLEINASGNDVNFADGDTVHILSTITSTSYTNGSLVISGGVGITGQVNVGQTTTASLYAVFATTTTLDYTTGPSSVPSSSHGTITFDGTKMILASGAYIYYSILNADAGQTGAVKFLLTPTGTITSTTYIFHTDSNSANNIVELYYSSTDSTLHLKFSDNAGVATDVSLGAFTLTGGTTFEIEIDWDFTSGATEVFINGTQLGTTITTQIIRHPGLSFRLGYSSGQPFGISNFMFFPTVQHTSSYTKGYTLENCNFTANGMVNFNGPTTVNNALTADSCSIDTNLIVGDSITANSCSIDTNLYVNESVTVGQTFGASLYALFATTTSLDYTIGPSAFPTYTFGTITFDGTKMLLPVGGIVRYAIDSDVDAGQVGAVKFLLTPTATWGSTTIIFQISIGAGTQVDLIELYYTSSTLHLIYGDSSGTAVDATLGAFAPTGGVTFEIEIDWNFTSGATRVFVNGTQSGSTITGVITRTSATDMQFGAGNSTTMSFAKFVFYTTVQHTTTYTTGYTLVSSEMQVYGNITTSAPSLALQVATKKYVDAQIAGVSGGSMLTINARLLGAMAVTPQTAPIDVLELTKTGNYIRVHVNEVISIKITNDDIHTAAGIIPSGWLPYTTIRRNCVVINGAVVSPPTTVQGEMEINTDGSIYWYVGMSQGSFTSNYVGVVDEVFFYYGGA